MLSKYHHILQELRKLFEEERRGMVVKPSLRTEAALTYEEVRRVQ